MQDKKVVKIVGNRTGIGNQIQFIPFIEELKKDYLVWSDSKLFYEFGVLSEEYDRADYYVTVFSYDVKKVFEEQYRSPGKYYGFRYRVKRRHLGLGYSKSLRFNEDRSEVLNNLDLYNYCFNQNLDAFNFHLDGWNPKPGLVGFGISPKIEKTMPIETWKQLISRVKELGFEVKILDYDIGEPGYIKTPKLSDLKRELSELQYFIGVDSGVMHLADILGIPSLIMFGSTSIEKNAPFNGKSIVYSRELECSPCFDWGRIDCPFQFNCMNFEVDKILEKFDELCKNQ